jgi:voltage-gated potassium channel Kch
MNAEIEGATSQGAATAVEAAPDTDVKATSYELFIGAISVLSLINLVLYVLPLDADARRVIVALDLFLALILLTDFCYRLISAPRRAHYFLKEGGWADLLGSMPLVEFRVARLFRVVRVIQHHRRYGVRRAVRSLVRDPAGSVLAFVAFFGVLVVEIASLTILEAEGTQGGANIITASDALWWSVVTIATVGYGDRYPVSNAGRLIGVALMIAGVSLFSVFTGYLANRFIRPADRGDITQFTAEIAEIRRLLAEQEAGRAALEAKLEAITELAQRGTAPSPAARERGA